VKEVTVVLDGLPADAEPFIVCSSCGGPCVSTYPFRCIKKCKKRRKIKAKDRKRAIRRRKYKQRHLAMGLCELCGERAVTKRHCRKHADQANQRGARYRERKRAATSATEGSTYAARVSSTACASAADGQCDSQQFVDDKVVPLARYRP